MKAIAQLITRLWQRYTAWCDRMGLTEDNRRCCMPRLSDPPLEKTPPRKAQDDH
ncbi:hypothetical protein [Shewanella mangrovi]|uniref:hypothetical protein n=1 Tax=Shewanella mangrovi TaxID=1515746 RepID=UPI000ACE9ED0|nr:hypothetical protein [Shewanella mangrovi]